MVGIGTCEFIYQAASPDPSYLSGILEKDCFSRSSFAMTRQNVAPIPCGRHIAREFIHLAGDKPPALRPMWCRSFPRSRARTGVVSIWRYIITEIHAGGFSCTNFMSMSQSCVSRSINSSASLSNDSSVSGLLILG